MPVFLHSMSSNVGDAAWSATISISSTKTMEVYRRMTTARKDLLEITGKGGNLTENAAAYMALIGGLRATLCYLHELSIPPSSTTIMAKTTNTVVMLQMSSRCRVRDSYVSLYYAVAKGLAQHFRSVTFCKIDVRNSEANGFPQKVLAITCHTLKQPITRTSSIIYAPSCAGLVEGTVMGVSTLASHDLGVADVNPYMLVDARFLRKLPNLGSNALRNVTNSYPINVAVNHPNTSVLGVIFINVGLPWPKSDGKHPEIVHWVWVFVIDWLPVPLHTSVMDPNSPFFSIDGIGSTSDLGNIPFEPSVVPPCNADHPFWSTLEMNCNKS